MFNGNGTVTVMVIQQKAFRYFNKFNISCNALRFTTAIVLNAIPTISYNSTLTRRYANWDISLWLLGSFSETVTEYKCSIELLNWFLSIQNFYYSRCGDDIFTFFTLSISTSFPSFTYPLQLCLSLSFSHSISDNFTH